jgi:hypothetical protein
MRGWTHPCNAAGTNAWETPAAGISSAAQLFVPSSHVGSLELQHASSTDKIRVPGSGLKSDFHEILIQAVSNSGWFCHGTKPGPAFGQLRCSYPGQSSRFLEGPHKNKRRLSMQDSMGKDRLIFNSGDGLFGPQSQGEVVSPST